MVSTEPTSIIEALLPVAVPVYSLDPTAITGDAAWGLAAATPSDQTRTPDEVREALADALAIEVLDDLLSHAVEVQRQALVAERQAMVGQMASQDAAARDLRQPAE